MKRFGRLIVLLMTAAMIAFVAPRPAMAAPGDNFVIDDALSSARTQWWSDARFGMFIHWGLYSAFAGQYGSCRDAEWIKRNCGIPDADYAAKAATWNPTSFDANAIVKLAKDAGQKYIVITSKHHDGFAMWPTQVNDWNIRSRTPFKRDPLRELSDAARANGIHFGVYYSIWDWHDPDFTRDLPAYLTRAKAQLRELITNYDPEILWFDGEWESPFTAQDGEQLEKFVRELKPGIIINNRVSKRRLVDGDYDTPEQQLAGSPPSAQLQESCLTISNTWGYAAWDTAFKSPTELTRDLVHLTSNGTNFLLNIGPTDTGAIQPGQLTALQGMKPWMATNGASIYAAGYSGLTGEPSWGKITRKQNKLYLNVYTWPGAGGTLHVPARRPFSVSAARVLGSSQSVTVRAAGDGFDFIPSGPATNSIATVIEADITTPAPAAVGTGTGLKAEFWNNTTFTGAPALSRTDPTVNYAWRFSGSPAPAIGTDNFSSRWSGSIQPRYSETYTFITASDDTVQLWIDGRLIISDTDPHEPRIDRGSIALTAGRRYDIRLEQTENSGEAYAKLIWTSPNTAPQIVPQTQLYPTTATPIVGVGSGKCVEVAASNSQDGTDLVLSTCDGGADQQWTYDPATGEVRSLGKCLDVEGGDPADLTPVQLYSCNQTGAQKWTYTPGAQTLTALGKCLDAYGEGIADDTKLIIYTCHGRANQQWRLGA
ncbi:alpha-L-fucosidase [Sphaerisporangium fuscum]|uniref:alpha-L-fucosidase n=1 Tax=Sphaerisporangium fuscum TaxID=2835868 RepID=UPI001BDDC424|nr:alpha-L-fucosidase [Sphaerisporangium fuscum]